MRVKVNLPPDTPKTLSRTQKRALAKQFHLTPDQISRIFDAAQVKYHMDTLPEGTKVKLDYDRIMSHPASKSELYLQFIEDHKMDILTVEHDPKYGENPQLVTLKEDEGEVKWIFDISDLEVVELPDSVMTEGEVMAEESQETPSDETSSSETSSNE
jgi:hypothetical protein